MRIKSILSAIIAIGSLCACGNSEQVNTTQTKIQQNSPEEERKPTPIMDKDPETTVTVAENPTAIPVVQSTEDDKIFTEDVESISLRYYVGYNIASGDMLTAWLPCQQIDMDGEDLEQMSEQINQLSKLSVPKNEEEYLYNTAAYDDYELTINDEFILLIGEEYGYVMANADLFEITPDMYAILDRVVQEHNENNLFKTLGGDQITVTDQYGKVLWDGDDTEQLETIRSTQYYVVNPSDEWIAGHHVKYIIDLHNGDQLDVYFAHVLGRLRHADGTYEYVYIDHLVNYLDEIW